LIFGEGDSRRKVKVGRIKKLSKIGREFVIKCIAQIITLELLSTPKSLCGLIQCLITKFY